MSSDTSPVRCLKSDRLLFIGDSITDAGRTNHLPPLGEGYVSLLARELNRRHLKLDLTVINRGIAANSIEGLDLRWERDVLDEDPQWVFILIGINDAHVTFSQGSDPDQRLTIFKEIYTRLLERTWPSVAREQIVLLTPFYITPDQTSNIARLCLRYTQAVKDLAKHYGHPVVDLQAAFEKGLQQQDQLHWSFDCVHPTAAGHQLICDRLMDFLST